MYPADVVWTALPMTLERYRHTLANSIDETDLHPAQVYAFRSSLGITR